MLIDTSCLLHCGLESRARESDSLHTQLSQRHLHFQQDASDHSNVAGRDRTKHCLTVLLRHIDWVIELGATLCRTTAVSHSTLELLNSAGDSSPSSDSTSSKPTDILGVVQKKAKSILNDL